MWGGSAEPLESYSEDDDHGECHAVFSAYNPRSTLQTIVSRLVRSPIHSEVLFHEEDSISREFFYTAFMGEKFSVNKMTQAMVNRGDVHSTLALRVSRGEIKRMQEFMMGLVERHTPYNYNDLPLTTGMVGRGEVLNTLFPEVDDMSKPPNVFCSQAIVLCLKTCLEPDLHRSLFDKISELNSRATSPYQLFQILRPHCREVERSSVTKTFLQFVE